MVKATVQTLVCSVIRLRRPEVWIWSLRSAFARGETKLVALVRLSITTGKAGGAKSVMGGRMRRLFLGEIPNNSPTAVSLFAERARSKDEVRESPRCKRQLLHH